jgi:hypothetical protein
MSLELKVPPLLVMLIFTAFGWLISLYMPQESWLVEVQLTLSSLFLMWLYFFNQQSLPIQ